MINKKIGLLVLSLGAMALAGCGGGGNSSSSSKATGLTSGSKQQSSTSEVTVTTGSVQQFDLTDGESLSYYVTPGDKDFTAARVAEFKQLHPEFEGDITLKSTMDEDKVAAQLKKDLNASADVFEIVDNDLPGCVPAQVVEAFPESDIGEMATVLGQNLVANSRVLGNIYGVPYRNDNSYVLSYDDRVVSDEEAQTLEGILAACAEEGMTFNFNVSNSWYGFGAVWGSGGQTYTDAEGAYHCEIDSDEVAEKVWPFVEAIKNAGDTFNDADDDATIGNGVGAVIKWNNEGAQAEALGEHLKIAKLPTYTADGQQIQIKAMHGNKTWSMKKGLTDGQKLTARAFCLFMASDDVASKRIDVLKQGVPNVNLQSKIEQSDMKWIKAVKTMIDGGHTVNQLSAGVGSFWTPVGDFGTKIVNGELESVDDVKDALAECQTAILA